jgi:hypothetical protein
MVVKILKLVDGSFVIGQDVPKSKVFKNVLNMIMDKKEDGIQVGYSSLGHPFNTSRKGFDVDKAHVLVAFDCPIELIDSYIEVISMVDPV